MPGKKYPQPVDTYIGIITPEGIIKTNKKKVVLTDIEVWEYGFSKAIETICPNGWKEPLGDDWEEILKIIICEWSPYSYLRSKGIKEKDEFRCQFSSQAASLTRRIFKEYKVDMKAFENLKNIYLLEMGKEKVISKINPEQKEFLDRLGIEMEVC